MKTKSMKIILFALSLILCFSATAQIKIGNQKRKIPNIKKGKIYKPSLCEKKGIHRNFTEVVQWLSKNGTDQYEYGYRVEVTRVSNGSGSGNDKLGFGTAWAAGSLVLNKNKCTISTGELSFRFSDKNYFNGKQISSRYDLDYVSNAYTLVRNSSVRYPAEKNLKRKNNMIYTFDYEGKMVVFNFHQTKTPRIY